MSTDRLTQLAIAAARRDPATFAEFVTATYAEVWRFCAHLAGHRHADDLTQETYLRAFTALPRFAARSSIRTWLLSIARRVVADHLRAEARRLPVTDDDWRTVAERHQPRVPGVADTVVLRELVRGLEPDRREAFVLTQILGLAYREAAAVCDCPVGTVRSRVARAREDLIHAATADAAPLRTRAKDVRARGAC